MTTLREARDVIHGLEQQRLEFLTRKARGELVRRFQAESLAATLVRDARDRAELRWPRKIGQVSKLGSPFEKDGPR